MGIDSILHAVNHKEIHTVENASEKDKRLDFEGRNSRRHQRRNKKEFKNLKSKFVAVRSSATAEDSSSAAWAGQLDSFLNTTEETLLANVQKCWASLFTPRAIFYRFEKGLHDSKISVAVVIQKMIESGSLRASLFPFIRSPRPQPVNNRGWLRTRRSDRFRPNHPRLLCG